MMALSRLPYDNGMPNAVAGNLQCPSPVVHAWMREANREALVQKNRTLLAKLVRSSRSRSVVNQYSMKIEGFLLQGLAKNLHYPAGR
jgi:hypothetical protein